MNTWVTSDLHLGHKNIIKYSNRPFSTVEEMKTHIISEWNKNVQPNDTVYILGDVAFCSASEAARMLNTMHGTKILIEGNHDVKLVKDVSFRKCFNSIHKYLEIKYNSYFLCLFHYQIIEWNRGHHGSFHLFGHKHGTGIKPNNRSMDIGMDATGKVVSKLDDIIELLLPNVIIKHNN